MVWIAVGEKCLHQPRKLTPSVGGYYNTGPLSNPAPLPARTVGTCVGDARETTGGAPDSVSPSQPNPPSVSGAGSLPVCALALANQSQSHCWLSISPRASERTGCWPRWELAAQLLAAAAAAAKATWARSEFAARFPPRKEVKTIICFFGALKRKV